MRNPLLGGVCALALVMSGWPSSAVADTATATCEVHRQGESKPAASGRCSFSQRQGHVNIDLRDGESYSLTPTGPDRFKDQQGHSVVRTHAGDGSHTYRWPEKRIVVRFGETGGAAAAPARGQPVKVDDLVEARASSGESELQARGFRHVDSLTSGTTSYTIWFNRSTGQCLQVATADGRYDSVTDIHEHPKCQ